MAVIFLNQNVTFFGSHQQYTGFTGCIINSYFEGNFITVVLAGIVLYTVWIGKTKLFHTFTRQPIEKHKSKLDHSKYKKPCHRGVYELPREQHVCVDGEKSKGEVTNPGPTRGSLEISWEVVPNAYMYEIEYTEAPSTPEGKRTRTSSTKHKAVLDGLTRGMAYAIRVAAAGSDPGRVWSDEIISYVM